MMRLLQNGMDRQLKWDLVAGALPAGTSKGKQTAQLIFNIVKDNTDINVRSHQNADKLKNYLKDTNDAVCYWTALSLGFYGAHNNEIVPQLLVALDEKVDDYSSLSSASAILLTLKKIEPSWRKRPDVTNKVLKRWPKD